MHKHAAGIKVFWIFTLVIGVALVGFTVTTLIVEQGEITGNDWFLIGIGSLKIVGASVGLWFFNRFE